MTFKLEIITPRGIYLTEDVSSLTIKLTSGYRTFLPGHYPLIGSLDYAPMHTIKNGEINYYAIHGGAINVTKEKIEMIEKIVNTGIWFVPTLSKNKICFFF